MGGTVDRRRIHEQEDWAPKELRGYVGSAKLARHEVNMCRAPLCSSPLVEKTATELRLGMKFNKEHQKEVHLLGQLQTAGPD